MTAVDCNFHLNIPMQWRGNFPYVCIVDCKPMAPSSCNSGKCAHYILLNHYLLHLTPSVRPSLNNMKMRSSNSLHMKRTTSKTNSAAREQVYHHLTWSNTLYWPPETTCTAIGDTPLTKLCLEWLIVIQCEKSIPKCNSLMVFPLQTFATMLCKSLMMSYNSVVHWTQLSYTHI